MKFLVNFCIFISTISSVHVDGHAKTWLSERSMILPRTTGSKKSVSTNQVSPLTSIGHRGSSGSTGHAEIYRPMSLQQEGSHPSRQKPGPAASQDTQRKPSQRSANQLTRSMNARGSMRGRNTPQRRPMTSTQTPKQLQMNMPLSGGQALLAPPSLLPTIGSGGGPSGGPLITQQDAAQQIPIALTHATPKLSPPTIPPQSGFNPR